MMETEPKFSRFYEWAYGFLESMNVMIGRDSKDTHTAFLQCEFWCVSSNFLGLSTGKGSEGRQMASLQYVFARVLWY